MSYGSIPDHRSMALDRLRNDAYAAALREVITPQSVVLDLGAGTGILGLIAARLGAKTVYLVEPTDVIAVAEEIVKANGLQHVVRCIHGQIQNVSLPEQVDVIVSVLTGNFLLSEDLLGTLFHARDTVLKAGGVLLPSEARMEAVPVSAPAVHAREIGGWSTAQHRVDLGAARSYAANSIFFRVEGVRSATFLAEPVLLATLDFSHEVDASVHVETTCEITHAGVCDGWLGWFSMKLGDRWLSTSPRAEPVHWSPAFLPLDPPVRFERGERVSFTLDRPASSEWTWTVRSASGTQRHSTMISAPLTAASLKKASREYKPSLTDDGRVLGEVLAMCDGSSSVDAIVSALCERYPNRYSSRADALDFVRVVVKRHA